MGIRCFDLDMTLTKDGEVIVGHPVDLAMLLGLGEPQTLSDFDLKSLRARDKDGGLPVELRSVVTLQELLSYIAGMGLVQLTLEAKNFSDDKLRETAKILASYEKWFGGHDEHGVGGAEGLYLIVDETTTEKALRLELKKYIRLALGVRESKYGGDESVYCGGRESVPPHFSYVMPHWLVADKCKESRPEVNWAGVGLWLIDSKEELNFLAGANAIVSNVPAVITPHCMHTAER